MVFTAVLGTEVTERTYKQRGKKEGEAGNTETMSKSEKPWGAATPTSTM